MVLLESTTRSFGLSFCRLRHGRIWLPFLHIVPCLIFQTALLRLLRHTPIMGPYIYYTGVRSPTLRRTTASLLALRQDAFVHDNAFRRFRGCSFCNPCYCLRLPTKKGPPPLSPGTAGVATNRPLPNLSEELRLAHLHRVGSAIW